VPFVAYMLTASGFAYWLDSGEFVAAAVQLDIAHPPGHPLSGLYGRAFCALPLGSLSFRVALGQAIATATAAALMCRASAIVLGRMQLTSGVRWALAVFGAWLSAFSYGVWFQAVRPEVYALQSLLTALMIERILQLMAADDGDVRALGGAALALGLGLTNHHLLALLIAPAFLPAVVRVLRRRRWRALGGAFALGALALCVYAYLPLRAAAHPPANLGDPSNFERFAWVVSARVYAHDMGNDAPEPLETRGVDVLGLLYEDFHGLPLALALIGLYLTLRLRATRGAGVVLGAVFAVDAAARAWLGPVRANPDILGYLAPSYWALGALSACGLGAVIALCQREWPRVAARTNRTLIALTPLAALGMVPGTWPRATLAHFAATDAFDDFRMRRLPPRAVVIASSPQAVFRAYELAAVERARPDVAYLPLPFLRYPGMAEAVVKRDPLLFPSVQSYLARHDHLQIAPLLELSRHRPVFIELDTRIAPELYPFLRPHGALVQAGPWDGAGYDSIRDELIADERALWKEVGADRNESETARQLLWMHYLNAVQLGAVGLRELARMEVALALRASPTESRALALQRALMQERAIKPAGFLQF
jgi:hypothetical protein